MLLFFLSPTCPLCKALLPVVTRIAKEERKWLDLVFASDGGTRAEHEAYVEGAAARKRFRMSISQELGVAFQVGKLPYAALLDEEGVLVAKGLVNSREHLESLFEAKRLGVASVNEYMSAKARDETEVNYMNWLDNWITKGTRRVARNTSRRDFLSRFGVALVGGAAQCRCCRLRARMRRKQRARRNRRRTAIRSAANTGATARSTDSCAAVAAAPTNSCPPGTEPSPVTWIGTCRNPVDGKDYIISYNDCCGKTCVRSLHCAIATKAIGRCISRRRATTSTGVTAPRRTCTTVRRRSCSGLAVAD